MRKIILLLLLMGFFPSLLLSDAGVLIPISESDYPDPSILSLYRMEVNITIRDRIAETKVLQVYRNYTDGILEGQYIFTIPEMAMIKDFAIWEDGVRIPGIIMERKKARRIYEQLVWQAIDPGLLERAELEHEINYFSVNVAPIPPFGTKRVELFYTEDLPLNQTKVFYDFPFEPTLYEEERAESLSISLLIESRLPIDGFLNSSPSFPLEIIEKNENNITARFEAKNVSFTEDLMLSFQERFEDVTIELLSFRDIEEKGEYFYLDGIPSPQTGFFVLRTGFNIKENPALNEKEQNYLFLFDNSLSMMWKELELAYSSLSRLLNLIDEKSGINIACFSTGLDMKWKKPVANNEDNRDNALIFIRSKYVTGGTNIEDALKSLKKKRNIIPVLITDGYPTVGEIDYKRLLKLTNGLPPLFIVGIGDNPNKTLLEKLSTKTGGAYLWLRAMNDEKIKLFFETIGGGKISNVKLRLSPSSIFSDVYPEMPQSVFNGNGVTFTGKYLKPTKKGKVHISFSYEGKETSVKKTFSFPEEEKRYKEVRRLWAKRRVDYLLEKIRMEGEKDEWVKEIIALSKQFKFVTPYTSFLAAPRALLRPRIIRPGDPILIVRADTSIVDIVAIFPFGLIKRMVYHEDEGLWRVRFLVPSNTEDGRYSALLIMKDKEGNIYKEKKTFIIDRKPPVLRIELPGRVLSAGEEILLKAYASKDTKRIEASIEGYLPFSLVYSPLHLASTGILRIPGNLPTGRYTLKVVAEDFAFNTTYKEFKINVVSN
ncbi:MAG: VWA domain-containing protein [Candidatus Cloacimonadota bacterium]|nr:MAG: VWA domain-containing protein [Candidatus Cloacimonadota bacterium]